MNATFLHPPAPPTPFCGDGDARGAAEADSASALNKNIELRIIGCEMSSCSKE